jgi:hypothetical protein
MLKGREIDWDASRFSTRSLNKLSDIFIIIFILQFIMVLTPTRLSFKLYR